MHIPPGFQTLAPYFVVHDAPAFITFLVQGLSGQEVLRTLGEDDRIVHAQVQLGTVTVMISEASERYPALTGAYYLYVEDADAAMAQALQAGASLEMTVSDMPYDDRQGGVRDTHGNVWWISQRLVDGPYTP